MLTSAAHPENPKTGTYNCLGLRPYKLSQKNRLSQMSFLTPFILQVMLFIASQHQGGIPSVRSLLYGSPRCHVELFNHERSELSPFLQRSATYIACQAQVQENKPRKSQNNTVFFLFPYANTVFLVPGKEMSPGKSVK